MARLDLVTLTEAIKFYKEKTGIKIGKPFVLNRIYKNVLSGVQTGSGLWLIKKEDILKLKKKKAGPPLGNKNNPYGRSGRKKEKNKMN